MNDLIKKLKDKTYVRAFGLMLPKERECFRKVGKGNCTLYGGKERGWWNCAVAEGFDDICTYAIKPDYQPEFVDLEIKKGFIKNDIQCLHRVERLGVYDADCPFELPYYFTLINQLTSLPNFVEFRYENGITVDLIHVASKVAQDRKVYALLRREE